MKQCLRRKLDAKKRRWQPRSKNQKSFMPSPMLRFPATKLELAQKTQAITCGGLAFVQPMVRQVGLGEIIHRTDLPAARILKHTTASLTRDQERQGTSDFHTCPPQTIRPKRQTNA